MLRQAEQCLSARVQGVGVIIESGVKASMAVQDSGSGGEGNRLGVILELDGVRYALPVEVVERVARMAALTRVPDAPGHVLGVLNVGGEVLPVLDLRLRLGHDRREPRLDDRLVVVEVGGTRFVVPADGVVGPVDLGRGMPPPEPVPTADPVREVLAEDGELVMVLEPEKLDLHGWRPAEKPKPPAAAPGKSRRRRASRTKKRPEEGASGG